MSIAILTSDEELMECMLEKKPEKQALTFFNHPNMLIEGLENGSFTLIVLSDHFFIFSSFCEYIERIKSLYPEVKVIILLSNQHDAIESTKFIKFALSKQLAYVHPGQSSIYVTNKVYQQYFGKEISVDEIYGDKVVLFLGTTPNIGTTVVSFSTALQLAKQTEEQVAYICLNLKSSKIHRYLGVDVPAITLDSIRAEVKSRALNNNRLMQCGISMPDTPNLHILCGNMVREQAEFYTLEDMHYFLDEAAKTFDLCVVEVNAYWDNAATICGMLYAGTKIVVSTSQLSHFQEDMHRWLKSLSFVFGKDSSSFDLFITQAANKTVLNGYSYKDIRNETGMNIVGQMGKSEQMDDILNQGKIAELLKQEPRLAEDLSGFIHMLIHVHKMRTKKLLKQKSWLNRLLSRAGAI